ncbi:MAG: MBL fold metallo-hydrolase [Micrococcales bacterium]|nr:MBL fold metallo-hydrolase [Micrococcales bacterium]
MRLTIVGCSGSFAGPESPASSYLVRADDSDGRTWSVVLDLGNGSLGALQRHVRPAELDAVLISHLHPDHCIDLTGLYVVRKYGPTGECLDRLPVHGPAGTAEQLAAAYHGVGPEGMVAEFDFHTLADREPIVIGPFTITPVAVNHPVEAYGFRVEAEGSVLAYSGDTDACEALTPLFTGADLVLTDSAFVDGRDDIEGIHLSGSRAAQAAVDAGGVRRLMLTHIPAWNDPEVCRAQAAAVWPGEVELARPDATYEI